MTALKKRASLFFLAAAVLTAVSVSGCGRIKETPNHLLGTWKTDTAKYKDRYLRFTPETITFGTGVNTSLNYDIKYFKAEEQDDDSIIYSIKYEDMYGDELELTIAYRPEKGGRINVGQIDATWHK